MQLSETILRPGSEQAAELVADLQRKRALLEAGDPAHADIRPALILGGGAMRGVFAGGVVTALQELGMTQVFDDVIGISVGASAGAYFLAGQAEIGTSLFPEELIGDEFVKFRRFWNIMNVGFLEKILANGDKALDQTALQANRGRLHIVVTNIKTAQPEYIPTGDLPAADLVKFIQASSAVPGVSRPVMIDGKRYGDGISTCRNPIRYAVDVLGATHVLYVANQQLRATAVPSVRGRLLSATLTTGYSKEFREVFRNRHVGGDEVATTVHDHDAKLGILLPTYERLGSLTRSPELLVDATKHATSFTHAVFS